MQPVFVTGAIGFLGAHLVCALLQKGYRVIALKRPESSLSEFNYISGLYFRHDRGLGVKNLEWVKGDITDYEVLEEYLQKDQMVFHCAALVSFYKKDRADLFNTNINGTRNIVDACLTKQCKKLIYVSSTAAIGRNEQGKLTDESDYWDEKDEPSNYSISKYYAELEVWRGVEEGLNAVIVNPPIIIGPCNWNKSTGLFFTNASKNFPFYAPGSNAFVYVNDVVKAMIMLSDSTISGERFLVVSENKTLHNFMNTISDAFHKKRPSIKVTPWMAQIAWRWFGIIGFITGTRGLISKESSASSFKQIAYSSQKIKDALGFEFTNLDDAIKETADMYSSSKYPI